MRLIREREADVDRALAASCLPFCLDHLTSSQHFAHGTNGYCTSVYQIGAIHGINVVHGNSTEDGCVAVEGISGQCSRWFRTGERHMYSRGQK